MVWRVCEYPGRHDYDTSSVTTVAFGGSPSADELQRKVRETFPNVRSTTNAYGLTESSLGRPRSSRARTPSTSPTRSVRRCPPSTRASSTPTATSCRPGETGEVLIQGPIIMPGYWNKPEATAETVDRRLAAHRRHRPPRRRRLPLHHRPGEGHDHPRRREHLLRRDREPPRRAPRDRRRRRHRRAPPRARRRGQGRRRGRRPAPSSPTTTCGLGRPRRWPTSRCRPTSSCPTTSCPATPRASCSRTCCAARARSASPRRCSALPWDGMRSTAIGAKVGA